MTRISESGLIKESHEVHRLNSLFFKQLGSAYYFKDFGMDWHFFNDSGIQIPVSSFLSKLTQEAIKNGIVIVKIKPIIKDFILNVSIKVLAEKETNFVLTLENGE